MSLKWQKQGVLNISWAEIFSANNSILIKKENKLKMAPEKSSEQCEIFLTFMEGHTDLAKGFVKGDKAKQHKLWDDLSRQLNACGPPTKDVTAWKKTWCDWRRSIETRLAENKSLLNKTGGGEYQHHFLSQVEERLALICNIFHAVEGVPNAKSFGHIKQKKDVDSPKEIQEQSESQDLTEMPSSSSKQSSAENSYATPVLSPPRKKLCQDIEQIMGKEKNFKYIATKLEELNEVLKENTKNMRNLSRNLDDIRSLKKKELEEMKRHNLSMEKLTQSKTETKLEFLKLKQMKAGILD